MLEMADALAQCIVCPHGGDGTCEECVRVAHHTHPDVVHLAPGGVSGYLVDQVRELVESVAGVLTDNPLFFIINSYTTGLSPSVMKYILASQLGTKWRDAEISADEIGLPVTQSGLALPCGATAIFSR